MQAAAAVSLQAAAGRPVLPARPTRLPRSVSVRAAAKDEQSEVRGLLGTGGPSPSCFAPTPGAAGPGGAPTNTASLEHCDASNSPRPRAAR